MNYKTNVLWDPTIIGVWFLPADPTARAAGVEQLAYAGYKITAGAPANTSGQWTPGATVYCIDGKSYRNNGTTAAPQFVVIDTGSGFTLPVNITDAATTTTVSFQINTSALTTGTAQEITAPALTSGVVFQARLAATLLTGGGAFNANLAAATLGYAFSASTSGVYTDVNGLSRISAANATTGNIEVYSAPLLTTGAIYKAVGGSAHMTGAGRYYSANDGTVEVFGIGPNGHIHSEVDGPLGPSCAITTAQGITAAAITAGASDTCGVITTTGTQNNTADSTFTITFGKTYTVAPKGISLTAMNSAGANGTSLPYVVSISATAVVIGVTKSATAAATPSWSYMIIA